MVVMVEIMSAIFLGMIGFILGWILISLIDEL